jgi:4-alpha-glucanotransferase
VDDQVRDLARDAGIAVDWTDAADKPQRVGMDSIRSILSALGYPCATEAQISESRKNLRESSGGSRSFFTATVGEPPQHRP